MKVTAAAWPKYGLYSGLEPQKRSCGSEERQVGDVLWTRLSRHLNNIYRRVSQGALRALEKRDECGVESDCDVV